MNKVFIEGSNMKKIILITIHKQHIVFLFVLIAIFYIIIASVHFVKYSQVSTSHEVADLLESKMKMPGSRTYSPA
jgi:hypothetical protein